MTAALDRTISRRSAHPIVGGVALHAELVVPARPGALVVHVRAADPRGDTRSLAEPLAREHGYASYLVDLLSDREQPTSEGGLVRFEIPLLAQRLSTVIDWALAETVLRGLPTALLASGIAAAAALVVASAHREVRAVVSSRGRPDLAGAALETVRTPTLLVVGEDDDALLGLNRSARGRLRAASELTIVSRTSDMPGEVARLASEFLQAHLG